MFTFAKLLVFLGIIVAKLRAATFFSFQRRARDRFGNGQQIFQVERGVPAGIEIAITGDADLFGARSQKVFKCSSAACISLSSRTIPTLCCIISCRSRCTEYGFSPLDCSRTA